MDLLYPFRKKKVDERGSILRGVFEENLAILGRGSRPIIMRNRTFRLKRLLLYVVACSLGFLISIRYKGSSSPQTAAAWSVNRPETSLHHARLSQLEPERRLSIGEFKSFEESGDVPLGSMLDLRVNKIVIDAGHGGRDSGTVGKMGSREKDITLDLAMRLRTHLLETGFSQINMTRQDDSFVALQDRVTFAKQAKADLFISIHINSLPGIPSDVIETYYFGPSKDENTRRLAAQENHGSEYGLSDFKAIVEKLGRTMKLQESRALAKSIQTNLFQNSIKQNRSVQNNGVKRAPFVVLLGLDVPSVLAEVSCLSNEQEEQDLNSVTHRENVAEYLADGILDYLNKRRLQNGSRR